VSLCVFRAPLQQHFPLRHMPTWKKLLSNPGHDPAGTYMPVEQKRQYGPKSRYYDFCSAGTWTSTVFASMSQYAGALHSGWCDSPSPRHHQKCPSLFVSTRATVICPDLESDKVRHRRLQTCAKPVRARLPQIRWVLRSNSKLFWCCSLQF
jgi:hypothetical protein